MRMARPKPLIYFSKIDIRISAFLETALGKSGPSGAAITLFI
jgi:hypothetical protein